MKKLQSAVQKFYTLLSFSDNSPTTEWVMVPALKRNIQRQMQDHSETETWALHFLSILQNQFKENAKTCKYLMAERYLLAYLQEACYQAAQKIQKQFRSVQSKYALEDLFQIDSLITNRSTKLFRSYQSDYRCTSLESYAKTAIFRFIGNAIYTQDIEAKREKFSDWGLLKNISNRELREALAAQGVDALQINSYCLARYCYGKVCQPQVRQGSRIFAPSQEELTQMAACYNQQHASQIERRDAISAGRSSEGTAIQEMLSVCIQAARRYRSQRILPIENDNSISDSMPTPWDAVIQIEEREQVKSFVSELFTTIPEIGQTLLKLWLGLSLTQAEIATVVKHKYSELQKQYQVARQLGKYNRTLLKVFLQRCQQLNPDLSLQDDRAIRLIQEALGECLQAHCKRLMYAYLEQLVKQYQDKSLVSTDLSRNVQYGQAGRSVERKQSFIQAFENQLEVALNLPPESLEIVSKKVPSIVDDWMQNRQLIQNTGRSLWRCW